MRLLSWIWNSFEEFVAGTCLALMSTLVSINVILRYLFNSPILWASEITLILFVWMIMFGIGAAARRNMHPKIEALHWFLPEKKRLILDITVQIILVVFLTTMVILSWRFSWDLGMQKFTGILEQRYTVIYLSMPFGFGFLVLRVCTQLVLNVKSLLENKPRDQQVSLPREVL